MNDLNIFQYLPNQDVDIKFEDYLKTGKYLLTIETHNTTISFVLTFPQLEKLRGKIQITEKELNEMAEKDKPEGVV